ncbi:hypothetical protein Pla52n_43040 [Stieleria varia]|uniref:Planctomycete cytochrome C n=2 Tax=Stieleria varia TaxID=2528005 RepID=A0A5C6ARZ6_9BACT|nr:hypothetical protein Pla52n_43040 [Stieleria varia]
MQTYCYDCHDSGSEIPLADDSSIESLKKNRTRWVQALSHVRLGSMPPEDGPEMDPATRERLAAMIDSLANAVDCVQNPNAGKVAMRRLNRAEYRNTIMDLTGVDYEPASEFPGDDVGYGFDNIGDVLSLPPILMEKYLDAAEEISGKAIYTPPAPEIYEIQRDPGSLINADKWGNRSPLVISSRGTVSLQATLPFGAMYKLTITASGDQGGDEPCKMEIATGGTKKIIDVPNDDEKDFTIELRMGRGTRQIDITFLNDYYVANQVDRNLRLHHIKLVGQEARSTVVSDTKLPASHKKIIFVRPGPGVDEDRATSAIMLRFASRAFRRPATEDEVNRLTQLAAQVRADGGMFEEGIQVAMQAVLASPHFLFRVERTQPTADGQPMPPISDYELATRVSYFLWSSMPDDELLLMAHRGQMRDRSILLRKVASMLQDRRANQFVENFAAQWLQLRNLDNVDPDVRLYRGFNDEIRQLMKRETLTFFAGVMRENMPVTTLLDADFTYINEPLAEFYGITGVSGDHFRRVSLQGTPRGGLLTHASVLTVTSNPTRTSPVKRGKWVLENLLNMPPPPAPPNVPELDRGKLTGTLRERMEQHRSNPACASCHNMMDPLGFALENFDAVGRWRTTEGREKIDASGKLPDGTTFDGIDGLRANIAGPRREQFVRCLAEKMLIYAVGRGTEYYDKCAIDKIVSECRAHEYRFAYLVAAIIASDPFQKQGFRES